MFAGALGMRCQGERPKNDCAGCELQLDAAGYHHEPERQDLAGQHAG